MQPLQALGSDESPLPNSRTGSAGYVVPRSGLCLARASQRQAQGKLFRISALAEQAEKLDGPGADRVRKIIEVLLAEHHVLHFKLPFRRINAVIAGGLIIIAAFAALRNSGMRLANTLLASWLMGSTLLIQHQGAGTVWHNIAAEVVAFLLSLVPNERAQRHT